MSEIGRYAALGPAQCEVDGMSSLRFAFASFFRFLRFHLEALELVGSVLPLGSA